MQIILYIIGFIFVVSCGLFSQDTTLFNSKELVVIDSTTLNIQKYGGLLYRTINISNYKTNPIGEVLNSIPLLNLRQYGGIGSLITLSLRGTNTNHTIISLNKIPLTTSANPFFDLNLLPTDLINSINISSSGSSSIFGSGAIGGVVDFETTDNNEKYLSSYLSTGSFGYLKFSLNQNNSLPIFSSQSNTISYESYLGTYPITFNQFGEHIDTIRTNSQYKSLKLSNIFDFTIKENIILKSISFFSSNYQQLPGAVLIGRLEDENDLLKQLNLITINSIDYKMKQGNINFVNLISLKEIDYRTNEIPQNNKTKFNAFDMANVFRVTSNSKIIGKYKFEIGFDYNQLLGNMLQKEVGNFVNRKNFFMSFSTTDLFTIMPIIYNASIRIDKMFNYNKIAYSWLFALNYFISKDFKLNATASQNFRFPSFDEMYYFNYGNINLLPERSLAAELSFNYKSEMMFFEVIGFINDIQDKIVSIPKSTLIWSAQNFAKVMNYGIELTTQLFLFEKSISINYDYILQNSFDNNKDSKYYKSLLPYIPQEKIMLSLNTNIENFVFKINFNRYSYQYYLPENIIENIIPSNILINASLVYNFEIFKSCPMFILLNINNLTDVNYELVKNYPMPGRSFTLTIGGKIEID